MDKLLEILESVLSKENLGFWQVVAILADGPKAFSELVNNTKMSRNTLSNKLKMLVRLGMAKREVTGKFPPSTSYTLIVDSCLLPALQRDVDGILADYQSFSERVRGSQVAVLNSYFGIKLEEE